MKTRFPSLLSALCLVALLLPVAASAADAEQLPEDYSNVITSATPPGFAVKRTSFLGALPGGGYQSLIYHDGFLYVENFDAQWNCVSTQKLELELPLWGGAFLGEKFNYVVCGNYADESAEDGGEVYRVIKYDKNFNRLGSLSFTSGETFTAVPFDYANVSMDESGDRLIIYTGRVRPDGHQSNISFMINTEDMTSSPDFQYFHVSHSLRHITKFDGDTIVCADLSDAHPVRASLVFYGHTIVPLIPLPGEMSDSGLTFEAELLDSGLDVTDLEVSDTHYFVVGSFLNIEDSNIYLSCIDKATGKADNIWLTTSTPFSPQGVYAPKIEKLSEDRFVVMWNCMTRSSLQYLIMDGEGNILGEQKEVFGLTLTNCDPILSNGELVWFSAYAGTISAQSLSDFTPTGTYEWVYPIVEAVDPWDGTADTSWYSDDETEFDISTPEQLAGLSELTRSGNTFAGKTVNLTNDIFMNESSSTDLSYAMKWMQIPRWDGTLNGNGHTIYNLYDPDDPGGLITTIGETGHVKAIELSQGSFHGGGCIADENLGIISFCFNRSRIHSSLECGEDRAGAICNTNVGLVYGCKHYGTLLVSSGEAGGIVGFNHTDTATINQCANLGIVAANNCAAGVVHLNHGWLYNCYSRGIISHFSFWGDSGRSLSGIITSIGGSSKAQNQTDSCYSLGQFSYEPDKLNWGIFAISGRDASHINCYTNTSNQADGASRLSEEEMRSPAFLDLLNQQSNNILPAWVADTENINNGYPITVAEQNYAKGIYKIQPELWMSFRGTQTMHTGETFSSNCKTYYNESDLVITAADSDIVHCSFEDDRLSITALRTGETYINFHFDETENVVATDYQLKIVVTPDHEWVNGTCACGETAIEVVGDGDTLEIFIPGLPEDAHIISAFYTAKNKMVACFVDEPSNEPIVHHDPRIAARDTQYCYVYILDKNWSPLMDPIFDRV